MAYIKGLHGLRALSVLFVILTHLGIIEKLQGYYIFDRIWYMFSGETGVSIFFCLSGFLITNLLLIEFNEVGTINLKQFYLRRIKRLFPVWIVFYAFLFFLILLDLVSINNRSLIESVFFCYNYISFKNYNSELGHIWSLSLEVQYYLIWPLMIYLSKSIKTIFHVSIVLICASLTIYIIELLNENIPNYGIELFKYFFVNRWFIPSIYPIALGSLAAYSITNIFPSAAMKENSNYLLGIIVILYCFQGCLDFEIPIYGTILIPISTSLFLIWIFFNQDNFIVRILEFRPFVLIGKMSYGIYMYQGLILRTGPGGDLFFQKFPINIFCLLMMSYLSFELIEKKSANN